mmetsp:Transcript_15926/g.15662  ORF Transcript_15926/g.15662 Transcript_15926/m.15662 type:complete len:118 (-) Transcript_15926:8-361(-)
MPFLNAAKLTNEIQRVLKPSGIYFVVSYGIPEKRLFHFKRDHLDFSISTFIIKPEIPESEKEKSNKIHYIYICTKGDDAETAQENWPMVREQLEEEDSKDCSDSETAAPSPREDSSS